MQQKRGGGTLFRRMLAFLLAVTLMQMLVYVGVFFGGDILAETRNNAFYILSERTANRKLDLENDMVQRWSNVGEARDVLLATTANLLAERQVDLPTLMQDKALSQEALARSADALVAMLRRTGVTGAFAILDCASGDKEYPGIYIRDYDPVNYSGDNADLLLERGLPQVARALDIPMDSYWSAMFRFGEGYEGYEQFFSAMDAARQATPQERQKNYFYHWSTSFSLSGADRPVVVYTVPLVWQDGTVLGVLGVDITVDYLAEQLKYDELGENRVGAYYLGVSSDGGQTYTTVCTSGPNFRAQYGQAKTLTVTAHETAGIVTLPGDTAGANTVYGAVQPLKLYNTNTPFENEQWALIGILRGEHLLKFPNRLQAVLLISLGISLVLGLCIVLIATRSFIHPISQLMADLGRSNPNKPIQLRRIRIAELDALSSAIETLSNAAAASAARTSQIIAMSHIPIGVFEYRKQEARVFCSRSLFELLGWPEHPEEDAYLPETEFLRRLGAITRGGSDIQGEGGVFRLLCNGESRWVQLFYRDENENALGAFLNVTTEIEQRQKIEYERDFDILTGLYNRRAFDQRAEELFRLAEDAPLKTAVVLMMDLDNLKYINDSYGHDCGDQYIQCLAQSLSFFQQHRSLVGRRSGDEFNVLLYGYDNEDEVRKITAEYWQLLSHVSIDLPDGDQMRVRASGGMAWYQRDAQNYDELIGLADFAMYDVKHTMKGELREFDRADYQRKSILIKGQDALNRLLEERLVRYALQPILSAVDGSIYGYEFLMRPMLEQLSDLDALFRLARAQFKLQQMEELTWTMVMERFAALVQAGEIPPDTKAFINSIGSQMLNNETLSQLEQLYPNVLHRVVLEITENEESNRVASALKKARMAKWGGLLALDDYGSGYNGESLLVKTAPDLVKVDISIIRQIDTNADKRQLVCNLVAYAKTRHMRVLAEGVERAEELETLIACGVDYLQGFYLARPSIELQPIHLDRVAEICRLHETYATQLKK